jgi:NitT/TauT family transport system permease protein
MMMTINIKDRRTVTIVWLISIIIVWEIIAFILKYVVNDVLASTKFPFLHSIMITLVNNGGSILQAGAVTFSRAAIGFALCH